MKISAMLDREIADTMRQTGIVSAFLLVIPPLYLVNSIRLGSEANLTHHVVCGSLLTVAFLMITLATSMFRRERTEGAMHYLKTLPISPARVAVRKIIPRLFASWIMAMLAATAFFRGVFCIPWNLSLLNALSIFDVVLVAPALLMVGGFLFDVSGRKSPVLAVMLALPALFLLTTARNGWFPVFRLLLGLWRWNMTPEIIHAASIIAVALGVVLPALVPLIALIPVYRVWYQTPEKVLTQRMIHRISIPVAGLLVLFVLYLL